MHGTFIVLEGPDGAGTSLHAKLLAERLEQAGKKVLRTAEPTEGPIGAWIREILRGREVMPASALQMLFTADRAWHVERVIRPALLEGTVVVSDRYSLSTVAYGTVQGLDQQWLKDANKGFPQPDCVILTLPTLDVCLERLGRREERDIFEQKEVQEKLHDVYLDLAAHDPSLAVIDTDGEKQAVADDVWEAVQDAIGS
ncbi:MAG: dTMP kinase [Candidatus Peribacteraceae bacterium]|nr:dTMP kinase [Candidatus Peribacteraceae bacterium]